MSYAIERKGEWAGVVLPEWLRFFDCRCGDKGMPEGQHAGVRAPWGGTLYGSERAAADMGLRGEGIWEDTTPISCSTYIDARTAGDKEIAKQLQDAIKAADKMRQEFLDAVKHPRQPNQGGSCCYLPSAITIANYGWSILADRRMYVVRAFN